MHIEVVTSDFDGELDLRLGPESQAERAQLAALMEKLNELRGIYIWLTRDVVSVSVPRMPDFKVKNAHSEESSFGSC